jgi:pimeloyl-ACP methyl ester carboxylesterase
LAHIVVNFDRRPSVLHARTSGLILAVAAAVVLFAAACSSPTPGPASTTSVASPAADPNEPTLRFVQSNGIRMRVAEMGKGPLVILLHGFPESWYSWRHQLPALAKAGYRVVAPDLRGYGKSDKPAAVEDYDIHKLTADVVGLIDAFGEKTAILIGHDWGAAIAWNSVLLHPERYTALVAMSVPYSGRPTSSPTATLKKAQGDNFYYTLYFQEPGVAEKEFDADPRGFLSRLYLSPDSPREPPMITDRRRVAGGWIPRMGAPKGLPEWLTQKDLDYYVDEFTEAGFRGGINFYRNSERNWETTPQLAGAKITVPVRFIAGARDGVIRRGGEGTVEELTQRMSRVVTDLRGVVLIPEAGHWVQQEKPQETNAAIIEFLKGLPSN